ncbi:MAG TPA: DUF4383 domain-containing protein [Allosphingosinicella sp.]|nr:DUF4383 domain-containing protein [Allosphingosinicella sp.]
MSLRTFARIFGIAFLLIGLSGFIPGATTEHTHPDVTLDAGLGKALGLFPVNVLHNIVHIAFGLWGLAAARSYSASRGYARGVAIIYALLMVMGLISAARIWTTFGLIPLYGNDVWLHALLAAVAAYFGFVHRDRDARV